MEHILENLTELHLVGYGGLGREIEFLLNSNYPKLQIFLYDDNSTVLKAKKISELKSINKSICCVITVGDPKVKETLFNLLKDNSNLHFPNIIFAKFDTYKFAICNKIGVGNIIMPQSIIGFNSIIGNFNLFGVNSGVGHDASIGNYNFIGPNCFLAGNVNIENSCKLSFGTFILQKTTLVSNINTMPYTSIYKNLKIPGSYHGNPAKII
jgi:UDP-3-O-[3-hydroxymyristoyl] glucosamine N-acyltransferase